jgi:hypothetical protein
MDESAFLDFCKLNFNGHLWRASASNNQKLYLGGDCMHIGLFTQLYLNITTATIYFVAAQQNS